MASQHDSRLQQIWYGNRLLHWLLSPLAAIFALASSARRVFYRSGFFRSHRVSVPVIVVGNITVGGTGKTPVTIWLARQLKSRGLKPGIVSRGYGGMTGDTPMQANASSDPEIVGDEPLLIATHSHCPVVVHPDRVAAARELIGMGVNVIISDDGLQHYRLQRDVEIAVVDGDRGFGNGWQLPAGPLREPVSRLATVDQVLLHLSSRNTESDVAGQLPGHKTSGFHLVTHELVSVDGRRSRSFEEVQGRTVHAVAAIGNPERFFRTLEQRGMNVIQHPFPDHAQLSPKDLAYDDALDIVMTEKDAVKCREFAGDRHWFVPVDVAMHDETWLDSLLNRLGAATGD